MVNLAIGTILGFLAGLGVGGGSLLILYLTLVLRQPQDLARTTNLLFFLPSALTATAFRAGQGVLDFKNLWPGILAGSILAAGFSILSQKLDLQLLQKGFGILLLLTGFRELFYRERKFR